MIKVNKMFPFFSLRCFLTEIENMFSVYLFKQLSVSPLSRNYRLIVTQRKFNVLRANMRVSRTSNFQGATIRPIVQRQKHSIVFVVHHYINFLPRASSKINSLISRDVMYISKCKITEPLNFQLSLVIEHPKYISF